MLLLITLSAIAIGLLLLNKRCSETTRDCIQLSLIITSLALAISLLSLPISRVDTSVQVDQIKTFQQTLEKARQDSLSEPERAAILSKIVEYNDLIVELKRYRENCWISIFISSEAADLTLIE